MSAAGAIERGRWQSPTDHAHVIALDRFTGELVWDTEMDDYREHYGAVAAPLVVSDLVVAGSARATRGPAPRRFVRDLLEWLDVAQT